ncbi:amidohydrolase family protein [Candidatus Woesearchaeota archaeon]|nr:amidohydrolase family protein [Candidatus Woesearchaeota archaeon]
MFIQGRFADHKEEFNGFVQFDPHEGIIRGVKRHATIDKPDIVFPDSHIIFPGFIDLHVHAREDAGGKQNYKETYATLSQAALHGGVTHVAVMPNTPEALTSKAKLAWHRRRVSDLPISFTHYVGVGTRTKPLSVNVPYKAFTGPSVGDLFFKDAESLGKALKKYEGQNVSFHVEDNDILKIMQFRGNHAARRPRECIERALGYVLDFVERFDIDAKLCHWPLGGRSLDMIADHKDRGFTTTVEVSPLYMFYDAEMLEERPELWPFVQANPALQSREDRLEVIEALRDGFFHYMATDHAPHTLDEKFKNFAAFGTNGQEGYDNLLARDPERCRKISLQNGTSGTPQLDTYGLMATWLMARHKFKPTDIARVCAMNPGMFANQFSEYEERGYGEFREGYKANFTVLEMDRPTTLRREDIQSKCGWSPYEGVRFPGRVAATIVKGKVEYQAERAA